MASPSRRPNAALSCTSPLAAPQDASSHLPAGAMVAWELAVKGRRAITPARQRLAFGTLGLLARPSGEGGAGRRAWEFGGPRLGGICSREAGALADTGDLWEPGQKASFGDQLGKKWGRISRIASDGLITTAERPTADGQLVERTCLSLPLVGAAVVP